MKKYAFHMAQNSNTKASTATTNGTNNANIEELT